MDVIPDIISAVGTAVMIPVFTYLGIRVNAAHKEAKRARVQVENDHNTNLRDDFDGMRDDILSAVKVNTQAVRVLRYRVDQIGDRVDSVERKIGS